MSAVTESARTDLAAETAGLCEEITDGLILAALERAERQAGSSEVWLHVFVEHLGLEASAQASRRLRPQLDYLRQAGSLRRADKGPRALEPHPRGSRGARPLT